jgi:hypothetical protein
MPDPEDRRLSAEEFIRPMLPSLEELHDDQLLTLIAEWQPKKIPRAPSDAPLRKRSLPGDALDVETLLVLDEVFGDPFDHRYSPRLLPGSKLDPSLKHRLRVIRKPVCDAYRDGLLGDIVETHNITDLVLVITAVTGTAAGTYVPVGAIAAAVLIMRIGLRRFCSLAGTPETPQERSPRSQ